jgi:lactate 2-monooxygenase
MNETTLSASDWQKEIYLNGFAGKKSSVKISWQTLEQDAQKVMSEKAYAYIAGGAGHEQTMSANQKAF